MSNGYRYYCEACGEKSKLTCEDIFKVEGLGVLRCHHCNTLIIPDDDKYLEAKLHFKSLQTWKYLIYGISVIIAILALSYNGPALLIIIAMIASKLANKNVDEPDIDIEFKKSSPNGPCHESFASLNDFKESISDFRKGINPVMQQCCICQRLTKQTIGCSPLCGSCGSDL